MQVGGAGNGFGLYTSAYGVMSASSMMDTAANQISTAGLSMADNATPALSASPPTPPTPPSFLTSAFAPGVSQPDDLVNGMINLIRGKNAFQASAVAFKQADQTSQFLVDQTA